MVESTRVLGNGKRNTPGGFLLAGRPRSVECGEKRAPARFRYSTIPRWVLKDGVTLERYIELRLESAIGSTLVWLGLT